MEVKLKNIGELYQCAGMTVETGEVVEVSKSKAAQLLSDFPQNWEAVDGASMPAAKPEAVAEVPAQDPAAISKDNKKGRIKDKK